jgi:ribosomal protein S18 acetylase RimI-like enzyme
MVLSSVNKDENAEYGRQRGRTEPICVRKPWRRRGLARALLAQSLLMFREMGFDDVALGLDALNPNHVLDLYESMGYKVIRKWTMCRKPLK